MNKIINKLNSKYPFILKNEKGATMVEYAILVALISVISIAMIRGVGTGVQAAFTTVNSAISTSG